jgi:hypothetical protein
MHLLSAQRHSKLASLFLFGALVAGSVVRAEVPAFVKESIYSPNAATVSTVVPALAADVVIIAIFLLSNLEATAPQHLFLSWSTTPPFKRETLPA